MATRSSNSFAFSGEELICVLLNQGWRVVERVQQCERLQCCDDVGATGPLVLIPLSPAMERHDDLLADALRMIHRHYPECWAYLNDRLGELPTPKTAIE